MSGLGLLRVVLVEVRSSDRRAHPDDERCDRAVSSSLELFVEIPGAVQDTNNIDPIG
jgi:hypothetical protein